MRFIHWLYATFLGTFWIPCERCKVGFGGHEVAHNSAATYVEGDDGLKHLYMLCPWCTYELGGGVVWRKEDGEDI